jgi:hypothetical protein
VKAARSAGIIFCEETRSLARYKANMKPGIMAGSVAGAGHLRVSKYAINNASRRNLVA